MLWSVDRPESRGEGEGVELTAVNDRSDHDLATSPFLCPARPVFPPLRPLVLAAVVNGDFPANARLLALPDSLPFSPEGTAWNMTNSNCN